jgi:uncharacterized protein YndB with AHSA1/START domain
MSCWRNSRRRRKEMEAVTSSGSAVVTLPTETEILITREFDAPRHLVFKAYTTPELIKRWWSGNQGEVTSADVDLRVGGMWRYVMVANDGSEVAFHGEYREIVPDERIVCTEVYEMPDAPETEGVLDTLTLSDKDGRTRFTLLVECGTKDVRDLILASGMEVGMQESYDHLEEVAISLR